MRGVWFTPLMEKSRRDMPSLTDEQIELLAEKKLSGTITPEEQMLLDQWLSQKAGEQMVWASDDADEISLKERLLRRIEEDAGISGDVARTRRMGVVHQFRRMAAAILLLLAAGGAGFFFLRERGPIPPERTADQNVRVEDIAPGSAGAILTLADGTRVILDSAGNGDIAVQGMSTLMKQDDQLIYEKSTASDASGNTSDAGEDVAYNTMTTPRGRQFKVVLSDGSTVWLNAASSITYPSMFTGAQRKVIVTGEVYFEVAKDVDRPFVVQIGTSAAKDAEVTVLGTHFNVMAYPDEKHVETTLMEGSVRVTKGTGEVIITPGQQARFSPASDHINVADVEADRANAWVNGKMSLDNLDVEAIMRQVSRWYNVDVEFEGPAPKEHFWGMINRDVYLTSMLEVMRANGIDVRLEGNKVIVSPN